MGEFKFNPEIYQVVGRNIKKFREKEKLSFEELSLKTNISTKKLKLIENDSNYKISINDLYKISQALNVNIKEFFV